MKQGKMNLEHQIKIKNKLLKFFFKNNKQSNIRKERWLTFNKEIENTDS